MLNLDLRSALTAKTVLRDNSITKLGLIKTSVEEAQKMSENSNPGHRSQSVIIPRSFKIFKNLLKQYDTKRLVNKFIDWDSQRYYLKKYHKIPNVKSKKSNVIEAIVKTSKPQIMAMVLKGE